ncbi:TIGR02677 family protein [Actinophytocola gossypii]|uniref:TIGR02677 family protein n=1 Tax=Actinophytocola gossypii TaxID=2812003 RepID=A0ABT2J8V0_9PSEU|nr:TIGR02677 family protein [Actinophytocola gossypii]MCT2584292.1 TIGR02677 family protein [Actinophytocola gossypii]
MSTDALEPDRAADEARRLKLYAYLDAREHRRTYLAIMRLFASTLLADLSAGEVSAALAAAERRGDVPPGEARVETVIVRLKQLVEWGNLVAGRREVVASSIAEFQHGSVRYQVSKLGVRVQRAADELLRTAEGAREVSRELLPAIAAGLDEMLCRLASATLEHGRDPRSAAARRATERLAEQVTTLFLQHGELAATVRDFYAYLGQVVTRYHLVADEISGFRNLLVEYIQKVVEDVLRHTPAIAEVLTRAEFAGAVRELLTLLTPAGSLGADLERARGRRHEDWVELTDWFVDRPGRPSQVTALREATARAIGTLLATVKRATSGGGPEPGRRAELLRLAKWFDEATPDQANTLAAAAFGLYSARSLLPAPEHDGGDDERTAWADGPVLDVTVSVRGRGDRGARGRTSRILDDPLGREQLLAEARRDDARHADALAELAAAHGRLDRVTLSPDALGTLCGLLTDAMAQRERVTDTGSSGDPVGGLRLTVRPEPGRTQTIRTRTGTLQLHDTTVEVTS